ncbi:MAG: GUN4 domain-containing protein [Leptolyngbyaceae cyanobacterium bins.302]|nr:GUN4 domain-containing protein [Leptolyngbyaceae cyanobacterium bins.302]
MTNQQFDVFLCYNSEEQPAVIQVAERLRESKLKPWLDIWELRPGTNWQWELEQQIENIATAAVFVGKAGIGPWQQEEIHAFLQEFIRRKCPVIPVLLSDAPQQSQFPIFLKNRMWVDFRVSQPDPIKQLIWGITGQRSQEFLGVGSYRESTVSPKVFVKPALTQPQNSDEGRLIEEAVKIAQLRHIAQRKHPFRLSYQGGDKTFQELARIAAKAALSAKDNGTVVEKDDLSSERGVDYRKLRDLLKVGKWKEADQETVNCMYEAKGRQSEGWLRAEDIQSFPYVDLQTIDQLWVKHSNSHFGFSVQRKIWQECGSPTHSDDKWEKFGDRVGWRKWSNWLFSDQLNFDLEKSPPGELPAILRAVRGSGWLLFSRLERVTCGEDDLSSENRD